MTRPTLRAAPLETVANCCRVADDAMGACRASGHRRLSAMNRGVERAARRGAACVAPRLAAALRRSSGKASDVAGQPRAKAARTRRAA